VCVCGISGADGIHVLSAIAQQVVRYVLFQMIEETARHAGHADIICKTLDGSRGI
jgi:trehalose/maltose hydrolase-like predicted phosphorylase